MENLWIDKNYSIVPTGHKTESICCDLCGVAAGVWAFQDERPINRKCLLLRCISCGGYKLEIIGVDTK